jgi:hypothetical protein
MRFTKLPFHAENAEQQREKNEKFSLFFCFLRAKGPFSFLARGMGV